MMALHLLLMVMFFTAADQAESAPRHIKLKMSWGFRTPDCVERSPLVLINNEFPGPVLRLKAGEEVDVYVKNDLEGVATTLHWHGFDQPGRPWEDGAAYTSDCPVAPGTYRHYVIKAQEKPGTHYYHGHTGLAKEVGANGMLLVDPADGAAWPDAMRHDEDVPLLIQDWYHAPGLSLIAGLGQSKFRWAGDPQSILINGRGHFNCSDNNVYECDDLGQCTSKGTTVCSAKEQPYYLPPRKGAPPCAEEHCPGLFEVNVETGKTYLLRVANGGSLNMLSFAVEKHNLTLVEIDGEPTKPLQVSSFDLHSGQRAGLLLNADQLIGVYWISVKIRGRNSPRMGKALLKYKGGLNTLTGDLAVQAQAEERLTTLRSQQPAWDDSEFTLLQHRQMEHPEADRAPKPEDVYKRIVLVGTQEFFGEEEHSHIPSTNPGVGRIGQGMDRPEQFCTGGPGKNLRWAVGRATHRHINTPVLHALYYDTPSKKDLKEENGMIMLEPGKVYEMVMQNYPACNGVCETHPWHLHGHHVWVVGKWRGEFNGTLPTPGSGGKVHRRDTILLIGAGDDHKPVKREGCGFTVFRFKADNPGAWAFHCHIEWHQVMGMGTVLYYPAESIPEPKHLCHHQVCGEANLQLIQDKFARQNFMSLMVPGQNVVSWIVPGLLLLLVAMSLLLCCIVCRLKRSVNDSSYHLCKTPCLKRSDSEAGSEESL